MSDFRADLHCHTTCSDGTVTPTEIIHLAKAKGLSGLSITDHDSIDAYKEALPVAQETGIALISGIEFSTIFHENSVHILAYSFDLKNSDLHNLCLKHHQRREHRNKAILEKLKSHGMPITEEEVLACTKTTSNNPVRIIGRPHIAQAMVKKGYVASVKDAFRLYIGEDRPDYVQGEIISLDETLEVIHAAKGFAIIAHPHLIKNESLIAKLLHKKFDGIECYYSQLQAAQHVRWVNIAKNNQWLMTGGSDFHGEIKPNIPLGCSWVGEETFAILKKKFDENNDLSFKDQNSNRKSGVRSQEPEC